MNIFNFIGALLSVTLFVTAFLFGEGAALYLNFVSIVVVTSGTIGATFLSYPFNSIKTALRVALNSYTQKHPKPNDIVNTLLDLSVRSKYDGILSLDRLENEVSVAFLRDALNLLVDGYSEEDIREILQTEMLFFKKRRQIIEKIFRTMSNRSLSFGLIGTIIGLMTMLVGIGDTGVILKTIPIALTSTLYGLILSNFILLPIAENISVRTHMEMLINNIIMDGAVAIAKEKNLHKLEVKLKSFLTPSSRKGSQISLRDILKKYIKMKKSTAA